MYRNFRVARACAVEAFRDFRWREYAPFGWILGAQLLFLLLALNLQSPVGMATVGSLVRLIHGEGPLHYPAFYLYLPTIYSVFELLLYTIPGSVLIPLALIRIMAPLDAGQAESLGVLPRLRQALLPTFVGSLANVVTLMGWQWLVSRAAAPALRSALPGFAGALAAWAVSVLGAYALAALFVYIPIVAIRPGTRFGEALAEGAREGLALYGYTVFILFLFAWPALPFLMVTQLHAAFIANRLRPELIAVALALYTVCISFASYWIYSAAARLHWAAHVEDA